MLDSDITVSRMAGAQYHDFCGTFDGDGHTLTFNYGTSDEYATEEYIAPFKYVSTVTPDDGSEVPTTIKNLHINGNIYTSNKYAAGLIACHWGTVNIENSRSSIIIHSDVEIDNNKDGTHGGFTGVQQNGTLNITGCVFDGKLLTTNGTIKCSGFVGYRSGGTANITDSIYAPAVLGEGETEISDINSATFVRNGSAGNNCYYTRTLGTAQGKLAHTITAGQDVTIDYGTATNTYNVSGITAYSKGLAYNSNFYAGDGDEVTLTLGYTGTPETGYSNSGFTVNAGEVTATR